jgi:hypothetical protein
VPRGKYASTNLGASSTARRAACSRLTCTLPPPPFPLDDSAQSLSARRAAESLARAATGERKVLFAPRTITPRKIRICRWALALLLRHCTWARGVRRGGSRCFCSRRLLPLLTPRPVPLTLSLAFFPTVGGSPILPAGTPASPATSGLAALRATVPGLGMGGAKVLLASLEEAWSLPRPTCPLTGPSLAACLMWAQGSCELPTAKPRMRSFLPPLRGAFLDHALLLVAPRHPSLRPSALASKPHG